MKINTHSTQLYNNYSGGIDKTKQENAARRYEAIQRLIGKEISNVNCHYLDLDGNGEISGKELLSILPIIDKDGAKTVWANFEDGLCSQVNVDKSYRSKKIAEILSYKPRSAADLGKRTFYTSNLKKGKEEEKNNKRTNFITMNAVSPDKLVIIMEGKENATATELLGVLAWCDNIKLPEGTKDLYSAIPKDFYMKRDDFLNEMGFLCDGSFNLAEFLDVYQKKYAQKK